MSGSTKTETRNAASAPVDRRQRKQNPPSCTATIQPLAAPARSKTPRPPAEPSGDCVPRHPEAPARRNVVRVKNPAPESESATADARETKPRGVEVETPSPALGNTVPEREGAGDPLPEAPDLVNQLRGLVEGANSGDRSALAALRRFLDHHPEVWKTCGDLGKVAERAWLDLLAKDDALAQESAAKHLARLKSDLAGPEPLMLEKLLVDDIGVCYLAKLHAEIAAASPSGGSLAQAGFRLRRAESAQRRFLRAVKTLTGLRALLPEGLSPLKQSRPGATELKRVATTGE